MGFIYYCSVCGSIRSTETDDQKKYCKKCKVTMWPTHVTTEEWDVKTKEDKKKIKEAFDALDEDDEPETNIIGIIIRIVAYVFMALSIIGGIVVGGLAEGFIGFLTALIGCLSSLMLLGFSEIIRLLQDIKNK